VSLGQVYQNLGGELHPSSIDFFIFILQISWGLPSLFFVFFCFCFLGEFRAGSFHPQREKWIPKQHFHFEKEKDAALTPPLSYAVPISLQQNRKEFKGLAADWQGL